MPAMLLLAAALASQTAPVGKETTISFASNGGLTNWVAGPPGSDIVYVRDRTLHWYRVALSGDCIARDPSFTLAYTTDATGTFDRFSRVSNLRFPNRACGVTSIRRSAPPPDQPGARTAKSPGTE